MLAASRHKKHFPDVNVEGFTVLIIAPSVARRESLRKAFEEKPGAKLYKFASRTELTPETFFADPVWRTAAGEAVSLLKGAP